MLYGMANSLSRTLILFGATAVELFWQHMTRSKVDRLLSTMQHNLLFVFAIIWRHLSLISKDECETIAQNFSFHFFSVEQHAIFCLTHFPIDQNDQNMLLASVFFCCPGACHVRTTFLMTEQLIAPNIYFGLTWEEFVKKNKLNM